MAEDKTLKVRATGIRVAHSEHDKKGTIYDLKGSNLVKVIWDPTDGEQSYGDSGEYRVGVDDQGEEHYDLLLHAVHSYIKVSGAAESEDGDDDAKAVNGIYVMGSDAFLPDFYQINGKAKISFDPDDLRWHIWHTDFGRCNAFYELCDNVIELPETGWYAQNGWEEEYEPVPTISKHELQVGQDVKLRKHHPDTHIPPEKYPGPPCAFNHGDVCTIERIQGLFFAPKISPDQWIPLRAAIPAELAGDDAEDATRLAKKPAAKAKSEAGGKAKDAKAKAKAKASGGEKHAMKMIKTLLEKVENLESEVKKLQK